MQTVQFISTTPSALVNLIDETVKKRLDEFKKFYQPKEPTKYVTRQYVADEMLHCDISTVHNLTKKGILIKYQCGGRVLYKREEVENAIVKLEK
ncbi:helix-turn-helix domain-containing protein [Lutibacter sp. A80]|uniref:helix-turn-helix domain-containing protein n=1 Tax=Lutibacter sp. A80 TaxID=2918453 RepID=UPI001F068E2D|nr:helix-turn-helix domain-containing protein [Lutibacter sp. A80]UMB60262.1 helix-turn-helix domain-containing protein [Lutibacter sp. A80]